MSIHVVDVCIRGPPVVFKTNRIPRFGARCGFGGFGAMTWASRHDRHASPSFLSSSPAKNRAGGDWPSRKKRRVWGGPQPQARTRPCAPWRPGTAGYGRGISDEGRKRRMTGLRQIQWVLSAGPTPRGKRPCVCLPTGARLAGGGPSASREMRMKNWPIRQRLFGGIAGAPNGVRRGWADQPIPWRQAQSAVRQGRRNQHQAQQKNAPPPQSAGTAH